MNKTISINIAGFVFNIEEGAYDILSRYLESIKQNFQREADCDEIMADIESRIAELFQEDLSDRKEVIVDEDVERIISIMGKPEDYVSEETADNFTANQEEAEYVEAEEVDPGKTYRPHDRKRLYRDEQNGTIGGVCTGLGWFFGIDPVLIKIGFILLTILGGSGILVYIILWIVIPEAKTTAEILEMQGEPVTLDSIKDHVKGMKEDVKDGSKHAKKKMKRAVNKGVSASSRLAESLMKIFGGIFILGGIGALLVLFIVVFGNSGILPIIGSEDAMDLMTFLDIFYPDGRSGFVFFAILIAAMIPILSGIFLGVKLLFDIKANFKRISIIVSVIWFLAVGTLVLTGIELGMNFRNQVEIDYDVPVMVDSTDVLFVDVQQDDLFSNYIEYQQVWNYGELIKVDNEMIHLGYPELRIVEKGDAGSFQVLLYKESNGKYHKEAIHKAEEIKYDITTTQNKLLLAPYFSITQDEKMRGQKVVVEIHVPKGKKVKFGNNVDRILVGVSDHRYGDHHIYANTLWRVDEEGFKCDLCPERREYFEDFDEDDFD